MTCPLSFDSQGRARLFVSTITNNDVPFPGDSGEPIRLEFEDFNATLEKSNEDIIINKFGNGTPDPENGYSSVMIMTAINDYVIYNMSIPFVGRYDVAVNYKVSKTSRGEAQFYYVDSQGNEIALGGIQNESTTGAEMMRTFDAGTINVTTAGLIKIKMKLVGGGVSGSGKYIGANYVTFTKK